MQLSLFLVNIWNIPCILSPTFGGIIAGRILGGFSSAGGSVTLAYAADMFEPEDQGYPIAFIVFSSKLGWARSSVADQALVLHGQLAMYGHRRLSHWSITHTGVGGSVLGPIVGGFRMFSLLVRVPDTILAEDRLVPITQRHASSATAGISSCS